MTIRKTTTLVSPSATRALVLTTLAFSLSACSMLGLDGNKVDYKASKRTAPLDVPPDLTQLEKDGRYAVPDSRGIATASGMNQGTQAGTGTPGAGSVETIGPVSTDAVQVERSGNQKWLVVKRTPEQLWPEIKKFWEDNGFESPRIRRRPASWKRRGTKTLQDPQDFIRRTLGKVFDGAYSTGERDKFRTRLERLPDGSTEVWISHRGAEEVYIGASKESTQWTSRPNDPALESAFLSRLVAKLTGATDVKPAEAAVAGATIVASHATLSADKVVVDEGFDRAWRRVGLALDRVGFTVEDRDACRAFILCVTSIRTPSRRRASSASCSALAISDKLKEAQRYRILVKTPAGATTSDVTVQSNDGKPESSPVAPRFSDCWRTS